MLQERADECGSKVRSKSEFGVLVSVHHQFSHADALNLCQKFANVLILIVVWGKNIAPILIILFLDL